MKANFCPNCGSKEIGYNLHPLLAGKNICKTCGMMFEYTGKVIEKGTLPKRLLDLLRDYFPLEVDGQHV